MKTILLARSLDLSLTEAAHIANTLGLTGFRFVRLPKRDAHTPVITSSRKRPASGGRYLARMREA